LPALQQPTISSKVLEALNAVAPHEFSSSAPAAAAAAATGD